MSFTPQFLDAVRSQNPLIHNITNLVSANFSANGLLALGASPMMAESPDEMNELASISGAVVLNLGTPSDEKMQAMILAGQSANAHNVPCVLDPVAVSASTLRNQSTQKLLDTIQMTAIRGNAGELAYLAGVDWQGKGVDAGTGSQDVDFGQIVKTVAQKYNCIAILTGEIDYICDGKSVAKIANGTPLLPKVTASGCLLSCVVGAFLAVLPKNQDDNNDNLAFDACVQACAVYAIAGQLVADKYANIQSGEFAWRFLDSLASIQNQDIQKYIRLDVSDCEC